MKRIFLSFFVLLCCSFIQGYSSDGQRNNITRESQKGLPVVDLTKDYPEKDFSEYVEDKDFVPLETSDQVLADGFFNVKYLSDQRIVGVNGMRGDVFIFGGDGKIISHFNRKGQSNSEYLGIMYPVFDEKNKEIFIADLPKNRCITYSEEGKFLWYFDLPKGFNTGALLDFDDQTLLAYSSYDFEGQDIDEINRKMPYLLLSKKDGSIVSRLNLSFFERKTTKIKVGDRFIHVESQLRGSSIVKIGQEIIFSDISTDTVFLLTQDKKLTPLLVRKPSYIQGDKIVVMKILFKTESYLFFSTITENVNEMIKMGSPGGSSRTIPSMRRIALDLQTGQLFNVKNGPNGNCVDVHGKADVSCTDAPHLLTLLKYGKLDGKLKEIAEKIDADDNPVVTITKYR